MFDAKSLLNQLLTGAQQGGIGGVVGSLLREVNRGGGARPQAGHGFQGSGQPGSAPTSQPGLPGMIEEALKRFGVGGGATGQGQGQAGGSFFGSAGQAAGGFAQPGGSRVPAPGAAQRQLDGGDLLKDMGGLLGTNPALAGALVAGVGSLLLGGRSGRGLGSMAGLGGLAVLGNLAYKAHQRSQAASGGSAGMGTGASVSGPGGSGSGFFGGGASSGVPSIGASEPAPATFEPAPAGSGYDEASMSDDTARLAIRAMIAAASADGVIDPTERGQITEAMRQIGVQPEAVSFLEGEIAHPATVETLASGVGGSREAAAQVYTAARLAIDPDTEGERGFLTRLATALRLDESLRTNIDATAASVKAPVTTNASY